MVCTSIDTYTHDTQLHNIHNIIIKKKTALLTFICLQDINKNI